MTWAAGLPGNPVVLHAMLVEVHEQILAINTKAVGLLSSEMCVGDGPRLWLPILPPKRLPR